jgi:PEP-CTERM motif
VFTKLGFCRVLTCQVALLLSAAGIGSAASIPSGWVCSGNCGSNGADGVVGLSPTGNGQYQWVSTFNGTTGVGALPGVGGTGSPTNGSTLTTSVFSASAGDPLNFYFNYVTSDGSGFADYAWVQLLNSSGGSASLLFTARTAPSGSIVPGFSMPAPAATLDPASVLIVDGAPTWSPLGPSSGTCFDVGCGYTGWIKSSFTISAAGDYMLQAGVVNWNDQEFDSGLALDGVTVGDTPITPVTPGGVPEPATMLLVSLGAAGLLVRRFRS